VPILPQSCKSTGESVTSIGFFGVQVTHGSVIKLQHERTKFRLHSHEVPYGSGSQQQSVTGFPGVEDANSFWVRILPSYRNEDTNGSMNF
jgi:dolichyl-phosphate-mannose--protein O-mannosyl transferase